MTQWFKLNMNELIETLKAQSFLSLPTPISFPNKMYTSFLPPQKAKTVTIALFHFLKNLPAHIILLGMLDMKIERQ